MSKSEDKKEDQEFERVVQNMLKTPPKPHKPVDKKSGQNESDRSHLRGRSRS